MTLSERLTAEMKEAMKAKDSLRLNTIRMVRTAIKNREIELGKSLEDREVIEVLSTLVKQRRESIQVYLEGGREELAQKEQAEMAVLQEFLPEPLTEEELKAVIEEEVANAGAESMKDMGRVMKAVTLRTTGRADGKRVSELVRGRLS